uniref:Uncharacterized protein n=2 Tax=Aegilops tauschii subsp. strangulata TaxID=200361 RepID=A0A453L7M5_AEGTS
WEKRECREQFMAAAGLDRRRRGCAPGAASAVAPGALEPFLSDVAPSSSRVQFRNMASLARWVEEGGAAEVLDNKVKLWQAVVQCRGDRVFGRKRGIGSSQRQGCNHSNGGNLWKDCRRELRVLPACLPSLQALEVAWLHCWAIWCSMDNDMRKAICCRTKLS